MGRCRGGGGWLLPIGSAEHEVMQTRNIHAVILPSCQYFTMAHFKCLKCASIWDIILTAALGSKNKKHIRGSTICQYAPWPSY